MDKNQLKHIIKEEYHNVKSFMEDKYGFTPELGQVISNPYAKSFVNEVSEPEVISQLRKILKNKQNAKVKDPKSGKMMRVDSFSASAVIAVYDAINDSNKKNFGKLSLPKMVNVAFKVAKVRKENVAKNHDGKAAPYGSGYKKVNELLVIVDKFDKNKQDYGKIYYRDGGNRPGDGDIKKANKELEKLSKKHKGLTLVSIGRNSKMYDVNNPRESVNEGYGPFIKAKNLTDIIKLSKQKKNATFYVTDDNNSRIGTFYLKNGKFAKATTANPNYDFQRNKTKLKDRSDVIYKYKVDESVNEASKEAMGIAGFTGTRGVAVDDFIKKNKIDARKLFNFVKKGNLRDRMDFVTAIAGKPNNKFHKMIVSRFAESVNEAFVVAYGKGPKPIKPAFAAYADKKMAQKFMADMKRDGYKVMMTQKKIKGIDEDKKQIVQLKKKVGKKEIKFYDALSKLEKKMGKKKYRDFLVKSLKDFKVNGNHYDYRTNAAAEEKLFQLAK